MSDIHSKSHRLYTIHDLLEWTPPYYTRIIHSGILNVKNRMLIFGDEGSWKSMLTIHTAHSLSRGSRWLGFKTTPCNVLRLQAELPMYIDRERTEKYCLGSKAIYLAQNGRLDPISSSHSASASSTNSATDKKLDKLANIYAYPETVINRTEQFIHIDESSGWETLRQDVENCIIHLPEAPLVVILDPLFKMFNRNLSEATDLKPLLDRIDLIMEDTKHTSGLSFIIVHHTRKAGLDDKGQPTNMGSQDASGSRDLIKWVDTIMRIDPDPNDQTFTKVRATFTKHRNADSVLPIINLRWHRDTLHPQMLSRIYPQIAEDELELRGEDLILTQLE